MNLSTRKYSSFTVGAQGVCKIACWWRSYGEKEPNTRFAGRIIEQAGEVETLIAKGGEPLDKVLQVHQRGRRMGSNDRLLLSQAVYRLARSRDLILGQDLGPIGEGNYLKLAFLDGYEPEISPCDAFGDVFDWQSAVKALGGQREGIFVTLGEHLDDHPSKTTRQCRGFIETLFSISGYWLDNGPWSTISELLEELSLGKIRQSLQLRVNLSKISTEMAQSALEESGIKVKRSIYSSSGLILGSKINLNTLTEYKDGLVEVQDEGSQLIAEALWARKTILDYCAGGGGKTLALASRYPESRIYAFDIDKRRLGGLSKRLGRAGATNVLIYSKEDEIAANGLYEAVLVDAPCSSTGTLRRNPDICWRWSDKRLEDFPEIQQEVLRKASRHVAPGGELVYATCSLMPAENEGVVASFLKENKEFETVAHPLADKVATGKSKFGVRLPLNMEGYEGDSFFISVMNRK